MKKSFCKFALTAVVTTTFLSGCNSAQLRLNSDDDANTEESSEDTSEDKDDVPPDNSADDTSKDDEADNTAVSTQDTSEDNDEDDSKKTSSTKSIEELSDYDSAEPMLGVRREYEMEMCSRSFSMLDSRPITGVSQ